MSDEHKGPCGEYGAVVDECEARGREIERLTRERDEAREDTSVARQSLYEVAEQRNAALARAESAERKVEKLREAIRSAYVEGWTDATSRDDPRGPGVIDQEWETSLARAALNETEKGDDEMASV